MRLATQNHRRHRGPGTHRRCPRASGANRVSNSALQGGWRNSPSPLPFSVRGPPGPPSDDDTCCALWLACDDAPALPSPYFEFMGKTASGRPNGYLMPGVELSAPLDPQDGGPGESAQRIAS
jgi:hypothetical protein